MAGKPRIPAILGGIAAAALLAALLFFPARRARDAGMAPPSAAPAATGPASAVPAVDPLQADAVVRRRLAELATIGDENRRLAGLRELAATFRGAATLALPLIAPLLADRSLRHRPDGSPTTPRNEALAMLQDIASDEAVALLIRTVREELRAAESNELFRLFMALGSTRRHQAAVELCRILDEARDQPGEVRDRIVDFFSAFPLRSWPPATLCAVVENTRPTWEALALDADLFGPAIPARNILDAQLATLIELLNRAGVSGDERAMALDLLRRISGQHLPDDHGRWRSWFRQNRR